MHLAAVLGRGMDEDVLRALAPELDVEASNLSQQLGVLRASGLVATRRDGSAVLYAVTDPEIAELLAVARRIRTKLLSDQLELLLAVLVAHALGGFRDAREERPHALLRLGDDANEHLAPVVCVGLARHEARLLESIDDAGDGARREPRELGKTSRGERSVLTHQIRTFVI